MRQLYSVIGFDSDCDAVRVNEDCDDTDSNITNTFAFMDNDCDQYINEEDCAPTDPLMALDEDGDGVCDAICQDDYIVTSQTELEELSHCIEITGNLTIENSNVINLDILDSLRLIGGNLVIEGNNLWFK